MKPVIYLRIASILTLIHAILHTIGGVFGKPAPGVATMIAATMRTRFEVFGVTRSYSDFYMGLGLGISISLTVDAIVFWLLAGVAKSDAARIRPILAIFALGYLAIAVNSYLFFFAAPVVVEILISACLIGAILTARPEEDTIETSSGDLKAVRS
jgi:hypothetical protein